MFEFLKNLNLKYSKNLTKILNVLQKNEISVTLCETENDSPMGSKFGGKPAVPADFVWPRFESTDYDGETANRPLSFLCQINLEEIGVYDRDGLLPKKGMLLFFYELETMCWGYDPGENGCARVYYFEDISTLAPMELPEDVREDYRLPEHAVSFEAKNSYPSFEEFYCHSDFDCDFEIYDEAVEKMGYEFDICRHKLLGYADPVQNEMLSDCERFTRALNYSGENYLDMLDAEAEEIQKAVTDWILLFQMSSIEEVMFGDMGSIYFYIRKQDLKECNFDNVRLLLQCA